MGLGHLDDIQIALRLKKEIGALSQLRLRTPPPLRSDHLDIRDAQRAKKMMGVKFRITSYHAQKFKFLHKWPNLQSRLELT